MILLENGRSCLYQWDIDQRLEIESDEITEVHFANAVTNPALVCEVYEEDGHRYANVPNILLQQIWPVQAYGCCDCRVREVEILKVVRREKPADYVYTETEVKTFSDLEARIKELEEHGRASVDQEARDAAAQNAERIGALSKEKVHLPMGENGNIDKGIMGLYAVSDGKGGIMWEQVSDEELLKNGLELTPKSGLLMNYVWIGTSKNEPTYYEGRFCTRKFKVSKLPIWIGGLSNPWKYSLWKDGNPVGEITCADAKDANYETNIIFDEVAVSYAYGGCLWEHRLHRLCMQKSSPPVSS